MPVKVVVAGFMVIFALAELTPTTPGFSFDRRYLSLGGLLSGFFGGLSGHQGALRSVFLLRCGLTKEAFIATGVTIACLVDLTRLSVYFGHFALADLSETAGMLLTAILSAFAGSFLGSRLVPKVTMRAIQLLVSGLLFAIAMALTAYPDGQQFARAPSPALASSALRCAGSNGISGQRCRPSASHDLVWHFACKSLRA